MSRCTICAQRQAKMEDNGLAWVEVMQQAVHVALEHTVTIDEDGKVLIDFEGKVARVRRTKT